MTDYNDSNTAVEEEAEPHPAPGNGQPHKATAPAGEHDLPTDLPKPSNGLVVVMVVVFALALGIVFVVGYLPARHEKTTSEKIATDTANTLITVVVKNPAPPTAQGSVKLPASLVPEQETAIYSRASGYLVKNECEINDVVQVNQEIALIEAPDIEAQLAVNVANLHQAQANVVKAQADLDIAKLTLDRYQNWYNSGTGGETEIDLDDKRAAVRDAQATLDQMKASVDGAQKAIEQTQTQLSFNHVMTPFAGMITSRNYDPGALLQASNTTQPPMFMISEIDKLRAFVAVPQNYVSMIIPERAPSSPDFKDNGPDVLAYLTVTNYPGEKFTGHLRRARGIVDPNTRTMQFLVRFDNKDQRLHPGMYGQIEIPLVNNTPVLVIPSSAMMFDETGTKVATVQDGNKIHFKKIVIGRDLGTDLEVREGLSADDAVVSNPGERMAEGAEVKVVRAPAAQKTASTEPAAAGATTRP